MSEPIIDRIQFTDETYMIRDNSVSLYSRIQKIEEIVGTDITTSASILDQIIGGEE